jgi:ubiquinone/menaquinone biosynthesis C-methylase UbiE
METRLLRRLTIVAALGVGAAALRWRRNPSACPYNQRFWLDAPRPLITRERLHDALEPRPGERILEVGPGTGYYALPTAHVLGRGGTLEIFDIQQEMLDHTLERAFAEGLANIVPAQGDARALPYDDARFDAAYLVTVLGEIPDQAAALGELARVVRPGGRIVVGELWGDPHVVPSGRLRRLGEAAGLRVERRVGGPLGFFMRFRVPPS